MTAPITDKQPLIAFWSISLDTDCPGCGENVDLLDYPDFWDGRKLSPIENRTERARGVEVVCPKCAHAFKVDLEY